MFSGIVQELGSVREQAPGRIVVASEVVAQRVGMGDSVAVNGACLTVTQLLGGGFAADVMPETLQCTTLGALAQGVPVNLERSLRLDDVVGGHLVTGHVDAVGVVLGIREDRAARWATVEAPVALLALIAPKGSVAVDGISLTVVDVHAASFTVSLIPHTLRVTTAGTWQPGARVNLEADVIARYVQRAVTATALPVEV